MLCWGYILAMESVITLLSRGNPSTTLPELRESTKLAHP